MSGAGHRRCCAPCGGPGNVETCALHPLQTCEALFNYDVTNRRCVDYPAAIRVSLPAYIDLNYIVHPEGTPNCCGEDTNGRYGGGGGFVYEDMLRIDRYDLATLPNGTSFKHRLAQPLENLVTFDLPCWGDNSLYSDILGDVAYSFENEQTIPPLIYDQPIANDLKVATLAYNTTAEMSPIPWSSTTAGGSGGAYLAWPGYFGTFDDQAFAPNGDRIRPSDGMFQWAGTRMNYGYVPSDVPVGFNSPACVIAALSIGMWTRNWYSSLVPSLPPGSVPTPDPLGHLVSQFTISCYLAEPNSWSPTSWSRGRLDFKACNILREYSVAEWDAIYVNALNGVYAPGFDDGVNLNVYFLNEMDTIGHGAFSFDGLYSGIWNKQGPLRPFMDGCPGNSIDPDWVRFATATADPPLTISQAAPNNVNHGGTVEPIEASDASYPSNDDCLPPDLANPLVHHYIPG